MRIYTQLEDRLRNAIKYIEKRFMGKGIIILAFEPGQDNSVGYVGNVKREYAIQAMRAMLRKWGALKDGE